MKHKFLIFNLLGLLWSCGNSSPASQSESEQARGHVLASLEKTQPSSDCDSLASFQTITVAGHEVAIALPPDSIAIVANLLILQGWNFPKEDWCQRSSLCQKAKALGYRLIMPEMGKSTYSTRLYRETRAEWRSYPTRRWLSDTLIPYLQETYCVMQEEEDNLVVGLSTGARGAALMALHMPDFFKAVAALSGDYDQRQIPKERILTGFYGSYEQFPERWAGEDNLVTQIEQFRTPIYLGHGQKDQVCPPVQTKLFYDSLRVAHPDLKMELNMPTQYAHNYQYWDYEVDRFLAFFEEVRGL